MKFFLVGSLAFFSFLIAISGVDAHEIRPAYLSVEEKPNSNIDVLWKLPKKADVELKLKPIFPEFCDQVVSPTFSSVSGATLQKWAIKCSRSLRGSSIAVRGLEATLTDVLVRFQSLEGDIFVGRLIPSASSMIIPTDPSLSSLVVTYFLLGLEHIWGGFDHLLFVLALLLIISNTRMLVYTITAFTLAHSLTLLLATLGVVVFNQNAVEIFIALTLVFLACEIIQKHRGKSDLWARSPWIIALIFGLVHGFGFAGALGEIGVPTGHIPISLLFFNLGVEAGQLLFIALTTCAGLLIRKLVNGKKWRRIEVTLAYGIGALSAYWVFDRFYWI